MRTIHFGTLCVNSDGSFCVSSHDLTLVDFRNALSLIPAALEVSSLNTTIDKVSLCFNSGLRYTFDILRRPSEASDTRTAGSD